LDLLIKMAGKSKARTKMMNIKFMQPMFDILNPSELANHLTNIGQHYCEYELTKGERSIYIRIESKRIN